LEGKFDFRGLSECGVGKEKDSPRTEILGKANALDSGCALAERHRQKIRESLSDTALNVNRRSRHGLHFLCSYRGSKMASTNLTQDAREEKL